MVYQSMIEWQYNIKLEYFLHSEKQYHPKMVIHHFDFFSFFSFLLQLLIDPVTFRKWMTLVVETSS